MNPDDTSHFILAGLSIPIWHWRTADQNVSQVLHKYQLTDTEIHTAWMLRKYREQLKITNFAQLSFADRRRRTCKFHRKTEPYIHLTWEERRRAVREVAEMVSSWG